MDVSERVPTAQQGAIVSEPGRITPDPGSWTVAWHQLGDLTAMAG
jgi:hypothetical protein